MVSKFQILTIYKSLMRESQKFTNYNFRAYALKRVRDGFKEHKSLGDKKLIDKEYNFAKNSLEIIKRQVIIGSMYSSDKLVIENRQ